jgi:hypothetical protein
MRVHDIHREFELREPRSEPLCRTLVQLWWSQQMLMAAAFVVLALVGGIAAHAYSEGVAMLVDAFPVVRRVPLMGAVVVLGVCVFQVLMLGVAGYAMFRWYVRYVGSKLRPVAAAMEQLAPGVAGAGLDQGFGRLVDSGLVWRLVLERLTGRSAVGSYCWTPWRVEFEFTEPRNTALCRALVRLWVLDQVVAVSAWAILLGAPWYFVGLATLINEQVLLADARSDGGFLTAIALIPTAVIGLLLVMRRTLERETQALASDLEELTPGVMGEGAWNAYGRLKECRFMWRLVLERVGWRSAHGRYAWRVHARGSGYTWQRRRARR